MNPSEDPLRLADASADETSAFEPIRRLSRPRYPVSADRPRRTAKETPASRRVRREISQSLGGMHRRRHKKVT